MKHGIIIAAALAASALTAVPASADTLASYTAGTESGTATVGQSFTVAGLGNYNDIRVNFFDASFRPTALGNLYLFTSAYTGTPTALASTTANRIGVAAASGNSYNFGLSTVLTAGRIYYAYADTAFTTSGSGAGTYAGGDLYFANTATSSFILASGQDANFSVTGTATAVPEPATWAMMIVGVGAIGGVARRRTKATMRVIFA